MDIKLKKLLKKVKQTTEEEYASHIKHYGKCQPSCESLHTYRVRLDLIRWIEESLDKRKKNIMSLNGIDQ